VNNSSGPLGEQYTAYYLEQNGCTVVVRNYRSRFGEIDIIARNKKFLIFVEVKTREQGSLENPLEAVTPAKQRRLIRTALLYLQAHPTALQPRFDVAAVTTQNRSPVSIQYVADAFSCPQSF
jgi:putative endonuclease